MNTNDKTQLNSSRSQNRRLQRLGTTCLRCYEAALRQLTSIKRKVEHEFARAMTGYEHLLHVAVNEAEAAAWETAYPHLLFPVLAEEKAVQAQRWAVRQRAIRARGSALPVT